MSGSSIVQNGKLVGAVTHVLVNDPTGKSDEEFKKIIFEVEKNIIKLNELLK